MSKRLKVIGHRGLSALYPENTLIAFEKALECGVDAIELDVHLTADRQLVVTHDSDIKRCSNGHGMVREMTLHELHSLDFGSWKGEEFRGTRISTLDEALDCIFRSSPSGFQLLIEIKDDREACADEMVALLRKLRLTEHCLILSFFGNILKRVHETEPRLPLQGFKESDMTIRVEGMYEFINKICLWNDERLTEEDVQFFHDHNILVDTYRVDNRQELEHALRFDIDSITSNAPHLIIPILRETPCSQTDLLSLP